MDQRASDEAAPAAGGGEKLDGEGRVAEAGQHAQPASPAPTYRNMDLLTKEGQIVPAQPDGAIMTRCASPRTLPLATTW
jgi:hypothetical protein